MNRLSRTPALIPLLAALLVALAPIAQSFPFIGKSESRQIGVTVNGAALGISPMASWMRLNDPLWIKIEIRNLNPGWEHIANIEPDNYEFEVTSGDNRIVGELYGNYHAHLDAFHGILGSMGLWKGRSAFGALRLDRLVPITKAGTYTVRLILHDIRIDSLSDRGFMHSSLQSATLTSNALTLHVLPARPNGPFYADRESIIEGDVGTATTGPHTDGFALSLTTDAWKKSVVELRNVSGRPRRITLGSRNVYRFTIKNLRTGQTIVTSLGRRNAFPSSSWSGNLYPDASLYASFDLKKTYRLVADRYRAYVVAHPAIDGKVVTLVSNTIEFTVPFEKPFVPFKQPTGSVLGIMLQSNRPVYVLGEPVLLRAALSNTTNDPITIWALSAALDATYTSPNGGATHQQCQLWIPPAFETHPWAVQLSPGVPWRFLQFRSMSQWQRDFTSMGCSFNEPGAYTLVGESRVNGVINTSRAYYRLDATQSFASRPLTIRVVSRNEAGAEPAAILDDAAENASLRTLLAEYRSLRPSAISSLAPPTEEEWQTRLDALEERVDAVRGLADPTSAYVNVAANLAEATWHLWKADNDAHDQCDPIAARKEIAVADYFAAAVRREVAAARARVDDAADPPPSAEPRAGLCH